MNFHESLYEEHKIAPMDVGSEVSYGDTQLNKQETSSDLKRNI
jgi:hypothetical protein